ncbi:MAG: tetratricopeptide repeat protein [Oscillospiraceae bacterium]|nr:tetratricopeptide repeat protein [Oscillospiraceae bacterium]
MPKVEQKPMREKLEEIAFLRQQCNSLTMRGRYVDCAKLIEDNMAWVYSAERWPENFMAFILPYRRCYPVLGISEEFEGYMAGLLTRKGIPSVMAAFFGEPPKAWSAEYFRMRALELRTAGKFETALGYADLAIKIDGASSNMHLLRGWILEDMDRGKDAIEEFKLALEINGGNTKARQGIARQYGVTNLKQALSFIEEAISKYPDEAGFQAEKAGILIKLGKKDDALLCYDKAAEMDPYSADYVYGKAELLLADGKEIAAIPLYKRAVALDAKHVPSLMRMAKLQAQRRPSSALEALTTVTGLEPANMEAGLLRGGLLSRLGDNPGAIKQYRELLALDENNADALAGLALCILVKDPDRAMEYLDKALAASPESVPLLMGRAGAYERMGQPEDAAQTYKTITGLDKKSHRALFRLGALSEEGDKNAALSYYGKAIAIAPEEGEYHNARARLFLELGREKEALDDMDRACESDPGNAAYQFGLAQLLDKSGNRASSIRGYLQAISLDPSMTEAHRRLAQMLHYSEPESAFLHIGAVIESGTSVPDDYFLKSQIIARLGGDSRAMGALQKYFDEKTESGADSTDENLAEIKEILKGGALAAAMEQIERAAELSPSNTSYMCFRAHLLYRLGRQGKALEQYRALLKKDPANHEALFGVGVILASKGDSKALENFDKAIAAAPDKQEYHAAKAKFLAADPDMYEQAVQCYDTAIPLNIWNFEPILEKAKLMDRRGDRFPAIAAYRRVLLVNPNCPDAAKRLGEMLCDMRPDAAWHYINHAMQLLPEDWTTMIRAARILMAQNKTEQSEEMMQAAIAASGKPVTAYIGLAEAFADVYPDVALNFAEWAVQNDPQSAHAHYILGAVCLEMDDLDGAQGGFEKAADLGFRGGAREKAVELLYRRHDPKAIEAAKKLPNNPAGTVLKAKIYNEIADPPMTEQVIEILKAAKKKFPDDLPIREMYVSMLRRGRSMLKVPIEVIKLEALRKRLEREREAVFRVDEVTFESEAEGVKKEIL